VARGSIGLVVTLTQLGYAAGLVLLVPVGDIRERRSLLVRVLAGTTAALVVAALAPGLAVLALASVAIGTTSVVAHIIVPLAAEVAPDHERGRVVGTVMSGLVVGILCARIVAGVVGDWLGWRAVYAGAAAGMVVLSVTLARRLPESRPAASASYRQLLRSTADLARTEPVLRRRAVLGALSFACFSVLWTSVAFLLADPPYDYGDGAIGLFGLAGLVGVAGARLAGRWADRGLAERVTGVALAGLVGSFGMLALGGDSVVALVAGIVVLDLASTLTHISNQSVIFTLAPDARSRVNAVYMTTYFLGGSLGSVTSAVAYDRGGWGWVCLLGAGYAGTAFALWAAWRRRAGRGSAAGGLHDLDREGEQDGEPAEQGRDDEAPGAHDAGHGRATRLPAAPRRPASDLDQGAACGR
jgi:predicted MFS family arabinose efflux permease